MLDRRRFLTGVAGILAAPAIVRVSSIMPVFAVPVPHVLNDAWPDDFNTADMRYRSTERWLFRYTDEFDRWWQQKVVIDERGRHYSEPILVDECRLVPGPGR